MLEPDALDVHDTRRLFLNVDTGRFVWKDLPVLRHHAYLATDTDGLLILHGPSASKKISALNPFTGAWIRFPVYPMYAHGGRVVAVGSSPMVVLYSFHENQQTLGLPYHIPDVRDYEHVAASADLNSEGACQRIFPAKPVLDSFESVVSCQGRVYAMDTKGTVAVLEDCGRFTAIAAGDWRGFWRPSFLVDNAGELLAVRAPTSQDSVQVFRVDLENKDLHMVKSIGNRAIFLGTRSLSVNADDLPTVEANCIYYSGRLLELEIHRIEDGSHEKLFEPFVDIDIIRLPMIALLNQVRPFSLPHVLVDYANYHDRESW